MFVPLARFADGTEMGRHVNPRARSATFGDASRTYAVNFTFSASGDLDGRPGQKLELSGAGGSAPAHQRSLHKRVTGLLRAAGIVDHVVGPHNSMLYEGGEYVRVPRFLPDADFGFPLPSPPSRMGISQAGFEAMTHWLRGLRLPTGDYEWSGRVDPCPAIREPHRAGSTLSFFAYPPSSACHFEAPAPRAFLVSWHGSRQGWSIGNLLPNPNKDLTDLLLEAFGSSSKILPESCRAPWWEASSEAPELLEPFAQLKEVCDLVGESSPMLWPDDRFCAWLGEQGVLTTGIETPATPHLHPSGA